MNTRLLPIVALAGLAAGAVSQSPSPVEQRAPQSGRHLAPIHTQPDDPVGGAYGLWSAGPTWKASFHDGFRFYAYAADLAEHPRLGWTTESLAVGGKQLALGEARTRWTPERHVTEFGTDASGSGVALREVYDVRIDGVEQSFVLDRHPGIDGELVVTGRLDTNLQAERREPRVGEIAFRLGSQERIRYGEALAFDAAGKRSPVASSFDGERIRLHVPAAFVAAAVYPLTIDPLTAAVGVVGSNSAVTDVTWCGSTGAFSNFAINAWVVQTTTTDQDMWASACREDGTGGPLIFQDVTTSWSTRSVDSAEVASAGRWLVAFERFFPTTSTTAARVQAVTINASPTPGTLLFGTSGTRAPKVGGRRRGDEGLMVSGNATGVELQVIDAVAVALGSTRNIVRATDQWALSRSASGTSAWCVLLSDGTSGSTAYHVHPSLLVDAIGPIGAPAGAGSPRVDGDNGRFLATWTDFDSLTVRRRVRAQRVDISTGSVSPGTVRTVSSVGLLTTVANGELAYDYSTQSHWALTWQTSTSSTPLRTARVARLGYQGGVVESQELFSTGSSVGVLDPFVCFDGSFPSGQRPTFSAGYVAFSSAGSGHVLYHRTFQYAQDAQASVYGSSCSNAVLGDGHPPFAGSQFYNVSAQGLPANSVGYVSIGIGPTNLPLDVIGMTGCVMLTDPILTLSAPTNGAGLAILYIPLNDAPAFIGDLYLQWLWIDPSANALGLVNSAGMHVQVR
jgi:hypothetical protein